MNDESTNRAGRRPRAHSAIVSDIGRKIISGEYRVGEIIPGEEGLVKSLSVGRSVVREALRVLAAKGLVEPRQRRGTQVLPPHRWRNLDPDILEWRAIAGVDVAFLRDLVDLRRMIEPAACELAAERATDAELELIKSLSRELDLLEDSGDAFIEADLRFHAALLQAAHNDLLLQVGSAIEAGLRMSRAVTVSLGHLTRVHEHEDIAAAVAARKGAPARKAMTKLIDLNAEDIAGVLGELWTAANPSRAI